MDSKYGWDIWLDDAFKKAHMENLYDYGKQHIMHMMQSITTLMGDKIG